MEKTNIKIDYNDLMITFYIHTFIKNYDSRGRVFTDNVTKKKYYPICYTDIRENLPLLNLKTNHAVGQRVNKLKQLGIIDRLCFRGNGGSFAIFRFNENVYNNILVDEELTSIKTNSNFLLDAPIKTKKKESEKANTDICPKGHKFGNCAKYEDCDDDCSKWEACYDSTPKRKKQKEKSWKKFTTTKYESENTNDIKKHLCANPGDIDPI